MDFLIGGAAAACAGFFTNPLEVLKTRLQLQGELSAQGQHVVHYKNVFHAAYTVAQHDGIFALQKGLVPALCVQVIMNGGRLGTYQYFSSRGHLTDANGKVVFYKRVMLSGMSGIFGHILATPFHLIKTHTMSQSAQSIAVGHQHFHEGLWNALSNIFKRDGVKGLFRGAVASIPRAFVASTSQLTSFYYCKEWLDNFEDFKDKPILKSILGSMVGGVVISIMVTPFDLVLTRLYNQGVNLAGKGMLYRSYIDCVIKIYKLEGIHAFYKGLGPMYLRLGPHTVLSLVFWDEFKQIYEEYATQTQERLEVAIVT